MDPLTPRSGETCTMMWDRLTPEHKLFARQWQKITHHATMTGWLLARGCTPVYQPPHPPRTHHQSTMVNFVGRRVLRRPADNQETRAI